VQRFKPRSASVYGHGDTRVSTLLRDLLCQGETEETADISRIPNPMNHIRNIILPPSVYCWANTCFRPKLLIICLKPGPFLLIPYRASTTALGFQCLFFWSCSRINMVICFKPYAYWSIMYSLAAFL